MANKSAQMIEEVKPEESKTVLQQRLQQDRERRVATCAERLKTILDEMGCTVIPLVKIVGNQIQSSVEIVSKD